jgi:hypothetical protein
MTGIQTEKIKTQAELLIREANYFEYYLTTLESCIAWIKQQDFGEAVEIHRTLTIQYDNLKQQKRILLLLGTVMERICDKYDRTEQMIIDKGEEFRVIRGSVEMAELISIRTQLVKLGIDIVEQ